MLPKSEHANIDDGFIPRSPSSIISSIELNRSGCREKSGTDKKRKPDKFGKLLLELVSYAEKTGDRLLFFIPPLNQSFDRNRRLEIVEMLPRELVLDYSDVAQKEFSSKSYWADRTHLNTAAAEILSRRIGRDLNHLQNED